MASAFDRHATNASAVVGTRTNAGPIDATKTGPTNLGSATGATAGAAANYASVLGGNNCEASGDYSTASGNGSKATALNATAIGELCEAHGSGSVAIGVQCISDAEAGIAMGYFSRAKGVGALALGQGANAEADGSTCLGASNFAYSQGSFCAGQGNKAGIPIAERVAETDGKYSTCFGINSHAKEWCSLAVGQSCLAFGFHSFAQGEDCHTEGQSAVALNHFNQANGRGSTAIGCNNYTTPQGERAFVHGFAAKATRFGQVAHAVCGFSAETRPSGENTLNAPYAGEAQTSVLVFRGKSPGAETDETLTDSAVPALTSAGDEFMLQLEDGKTYALKATIAMGGVTIVGAVETPAYLKLTRDAIVYCSGGTATIVEQSEPEPPVGTSGVKGVWTVEFGAYSNGITTLVKTGTSKARTHAACKLEFTEVILPPAE